MATPREQPAGTAQDAQLFAELCAVTSFSRGVLSGRSGQSELQLLATATQRDLEANQQRTSVQQVPLRLGGAPCHAPAFGFELRGATLALPSPSGRRMLVVRNAAPGAAAQDTVLELWGGGRVLREVEVGGSHGAVYSDGWFEGVAWSPDEDRVAYTAEAPAAVRTPLWPGRVKAKAGDDASPSGWRGQGEHTDDWGEQLSGKRRSTLFVVDVLTGAVHPVGGLPKDSCCGQVVWAPGGDALVFTAFDETGSNFGTVRKLGMIFCFCRPCAVFSVPAPHAGAAVAVRLSGTLLSAFSPRFNPSGTELAVVSADAACVSGAHNAAAALHVLSWSAAGVAGEPRCVLPVVAAPKQAGDFVGLFMAGQLVRSPWVSDTELLLCTTWGSADAVIHVDTATGAVRRITPPQAEAGHWQLLDAAPGVCVAVVSTPQSPPCLAVAEAPAWTWRHVLPAAPEPHSAALAALEWSIVDVPLPGRPAGAPAEVEAILLRRTPTDARPPPVILVPHGGPHTACVAGYVPSLAFLAASGFAVLQVNYRGSTGAGQAALESLLGKAGRQDVDDCLAALDAAAAAGLVDASRAAVVGGSHGGFLGAHLIGQAPERFFAAALRNPVTCISAMVGITDIPDWCFVETAGLGKGAYTEAPSAAALAAMQAASPVAHLDAVRTPVLMLLGAKDRRVPPSNGLAYAHALRERGVPCRLLVFPEDEHSLAKPRTELESYMNIADWLRMHVPT
jgi:acylaminoacyl-peptidase